MKFHRAVCMSGLGTTLRAISLEDHENLFQSTCRYFSIDSHAPDALDRLRQLDQQVLADQTISFRVCRPVLEIHV